MRFGRLDLNLLIALDHLLTLRSITQAGEQMKLTQSAMSAALRRLREYFDDPLLVQVGRQMQLTPRAEALRQPVRDILVQIESAIAQEPMFDARTSTREFKIILSDYALNVFVPQVLALTRQEQSSARLRFLPLVSYPAGIIERGDADLLIAPDSLISDRHPSEPLYRDDYVAAVWSDGPYAEGPLTMEQYVNAKHIATVRSDIENTFLSRFLSARGIFLSFEVQCFSFAALAPLVVGTDMIATIHRHLGACASLLPLAFHELPFQAPHVAERMQWHQHVTADPGLRWLRGLFRRAALRMEGERHEDTPLRATFGQSLVPPFQMA